MNWIETHERGQENCGQLREEQIMIQTSQMKLLYNDTSLFNVIKQRLSNAMYFNRMTKSFANPSSKQREDISLNIHYKGRTPCRQTTNSTLRG